MLPPSSNKILASENNQSDDTDAFLQSTDLSNTEEESCIGEKKTCEEEHAIGILKRLSDSLGFDLLQSHDKTNKYISTLANDIEDLPKVKPACEESDHYKACEVVHKLSSVFEVDLLSCSYEVFDSLKSLPFVTIAIKNKLNRGVCDHGDVNRRTHHKVLKATIQKLYLKHSVAAGRDVSDLVGGPAHSTMKLNCLPTIPVLPYFKASNFKQHLQEVLSKYYIAN